MLAQQILGLTENLTDRWLAGNAGHLEGEHQLGLQGAQTTCFYLAWMIGSFGVLASTGASALVSHMVGARDLPGANKACHQALLMAMALGWTGWLMGAFLLDDLLCALNLDGPAREFALDYLGVTVFLLPVQLLGGTAGASQAEAGDTRTGLCQGAPQTISGNGVGIQP